MEWACDAYQTGYTFLPQQKTYEAQLSNLAKWVVMEHMGPATVQVNLPGQGDNDSIDATIFNFTSQLNSLLSDPNLNKTEHLVVNNIDIQRLNAWRILLQ